MLDPGQHQRAGAELSRRPQSGLGSTQSAPDYSSYGLAVKNEVYYRVTVRVDGAKNTVSYVQAVILI